MVIVREHQPGDSLAIRTLLAEQQAYEHSVDPYTTAPSDSLIDHYLALIMQWIVDYPGALYVAEDDGRVIGFVSVILVTAENDVWTTLTRRAHVTNFVVTADYRGRGIGQRLLLECEQFARRQGCADLTLDALAENALALKAYRRFGFREHEILMHKALS